MDCCVDKKYVRWYPNLSIHCIISGEPEDVELNEKKIYKIAADVGGIPAGETNGEKGYTLTFVIAYIRVSIEKIWCECGKMSPKLKFCVYKITLVYIFVYFGHT